MAEMAAQGNGEIKKQQRHRSQRVTGLYAPLEALEGHARGGKGAFVCVCFFSPTPLFCQKFARTATPGFRIGPLQRGLGLPQHAKTHKNCGDKSAVELKIATSELVFGFRCLPCLLPHFVRSCKGQVRSIG